MNPLLVVGSANVDYVLRVPRFPAPGETLAASSLRTFPGGKGANQAAAAALVGAPTTLCAAIGQDASGEFLMTQLSARGVDLSLLTRVPTETGTAVIYVDDSGENQIVIAAGANGVLDPASVRETVVHSPAHFTLVQLEVSEDVVRSCLLDGKKVILNPAPFRPIPDEILSQLFLITPNETEFAGLTGSDASSLEGLRQGAGFLREKGVKQVIVTLGARGCFWIDGENELLVEAPEVQPVDTTGAGDAFNGALAAELASGREIGDALRFAVAAASLSTTQPGALASFGNREEVKKFMRR